MNTIYIEGHVPSLNLYKKVMNYFNKMIKEANASLLHEHDEEREINSLQTAWETYSRFELGNKTIFVSFSGFWDINPEFEKHFAFYYGLFKTSECEGEFNLPIGKPSKVFANRDRYIKIARGLYEVAKRIAAQKLDDVFYMLDGNEVLFVEGESLLYIINNDAQQELKVYRVGNFEFLTDTYSTILNVGGVSFYAPETKAE